jgi:hypothetical protein
VPQGELGEERERGKRQKRGWGEMDVKRSCSRSTPSAEGSRRRKASNNNSSGTSTAAVERKEIERKRRQHMKSLCLKLASLIPKEHCSKVPTTHSPQLWRCRLKPQRRSVIDAWCVTFD